MLGRIGASLRSCSGNNLQFTTGQTDTYLYLRKFSDAVQTIADVVTLLNETLRLRAHYFQRIPEDFGPILARFSLQKNGWCYTGER